MIVRISLATTLVSLSSYVIHTRIIKSFTSYSRFFRFIWLGDHLTPPERTAHDKLSKGQALLAGYTKSLNAVETEMAVCKLNDVDGGGTRGIVKNPYGPAIVKSLSEASDGLDKLLAMLDTVVTSSDKYKQYRKKLATMGNALMVRCDAMIDVVSEAKREERLSKERFAAVGVYGSVAR
jgi:hypothetical protein